MGWAVPDKSKSARKQEGRVGTGEAPSSLYTQPSHFVSGNQSSGKKQIKAV